MIDTQPLPLPAVDNLSVDYNAGLGSVLFSLTLYRLPDVDSSIPTQNWEEVPVAGIAPVGRGLSNGVSAAALPALSVRDEAGLFSACRCTTP